MTDRPITDSYTIDPGDDHRMSRARTVFYVVGIPDPDDVIYHATRDEEANPPTFREYRMPREHAADMGNPTKITVTVEPGDALNDLAGARSRVERARKDEIEQVAQARRNGRSWSDIGAVYGVSRQAAWERFAAEVRNDRVYACPDDGTTWDVNPDAPTTCPECGGNGRMLAPAAKDYRGESFMPAHPVACDCDPDDQCGECIATDGEDD